MDTIDIALVYARLQAAGWRWLLQTAGDAWHCTLYRLGSPLEGSAWAITPEAALVAAFRAACRQSERGTP